MTRIPTVINATAFAQLIFPQVSTEALEAFNAKLRGGDVRNETCDALCQVLLAVLLAVIVSLLANASAFASEEVTSPASVVTPSSSRPEGTEGAPSIEESRSPEQLEALWRQRWRFLVDLIDKPMLVHVNGEFKPSIRMIYRWETPGEVMTETMSRGDGEILMVNRFQWEEVDQSITKIASNNDSIRLQFQPDGTLAGDVAQGARLDRTIYQSFGGNLSLKGQYNIGRGWVLEGLILMHVATEDLLAQMIQVGDAFWINHFQLEKKNDELMASMQGSMSDAEFNAYLERLRRTAEEQRIAKELKAQARREFWGNVAQGMVSAGTTFSEAMNESQQREEQMRRAAQQGIQEGERRYDARMAANESTGTAHESAAQKTPVAINADTNDEARGESRTHSMAAPPKDDRLVAHPAGPTSVTSSPSQDNQASTRNDPATCVAGPDLVKNPNCPNGAGAEVRNQCGYSIDARICHWTTRDRWDCGITVVRAGKMGGYPSCAGTGRMWMQVRYSDSKIRFSDPP